MLLIITTWTTDAHAQHYIISIATTPFQMNTWHFLPIIFRDVPVELDWWIENTSHIDDK